MKKLICFLLFLSTLSTSRAQVDLDSLLQLCAEYKGTNSDSLRKYAHEGLLLAEKENNELMLATFYRYAGISSFQQQEYDTASLYLDKALELAIKQKDKSEEASAYLATGYMYTTQGDFKNFIEYLLKALPLFEALKDNERTIETLVGIGSAYRRSGNSEMAIKYLNQAVDLIGESEDAFLNALTYFELGAVEPDVWKMIEYEQKTIEYARIANNLGLENLGNQALAATYLSDEVRDLDKALLHAKECYRIAVEQGAKYYIYSGLTMLANIYRQLADYKACDETSLQAWAMDSTNLLEARTLARNIAISNIHLNNEEKAVAFFRKYEELTNEYTEESYHKQMVEMEVKYETEKKELRIASLEKEKQLYIWLGITGGVMILLLIGIFFYRHRLNKQRVRQLEQEKQLVATQSILDGETAERSRLARDLHDGLGGMLSVVKLNLKDMKNYSVLDSPDIDRFNNALGMLDQSIGELRRVAHHMMPESLMRYGLKISLEDYCRAIPGARFQYYGNEERLDDRLEVVLYRCAYELVNNAVKYAEATAINVQLMIENGLVSLTVHDNGIGFDPEKVTPGSGLDNIRTRVSAYNGKMMIYSSPGNGTEASVEIEKIHSGKRE